MHTFNKLFLYLIQHFPNKNNLEPKIKIQSFLGTNR